jgi:hypothetical protein
MEYRARKAGIPFIVVNPHLTSRECFNCHSIDQRNRVVVSQPIVVGAILDHADPPAATLDAIDRAVDLISRKSFCYL